MKSSLIKKIIGIVSVIAVIVGMVFIYKSSQNTISNSKEISITVIDNEGASEEYFLSTNAETLKQVMDEADSLEYTENDGMVMSINGLRADYVKDGAYWAFYVNDSYCNYGIAEQPINNGDKFTIEYTKA